MLLERLALVSVLIVMAFAMVAAASLVMKQDAEEKDWSSSAMTIHVQNGDRASYGANEEKGDSSGGKIARPKKRFTTKDRRLSTEGRHAKVGAENSSVALEETHHRDRPDGEN